MGSDISLTFLLNFNLCTSDETGQDQATYADEISS